MDSSFTKRPFLTQTQKLKKGTVRKIYANADTQKLDILNDNKNKSGVYRLINLLNDKYYIGSSINLGKRLKDYLNITLWENQIKAFSNCAKGVYPAYTPVKLYKNADLDKLQILQENREKAGVYMWKNLLNEITYIGSSRNLVNRMKQYFSITLLQRELKKGNALSHYKR